MISKQQFDAAVAAADANKAALVEAKANVAAARTACALHKIAWRRPRRNCRTAADRAAAGSDPESQGRSGSGAGGAGPGAAGSGQAEPELHEDCRAGAGIITRKSVEVGQNVSVGQNMMTLVSLDDIWITANFKETQLEHMRPDQPVDIQVDAYGAQV